MSKKITELTSLGTTPASNDVFPIVDVSDTSMAATGTTKKVTFAELLTGGQYKTFVTVGFDNADYICDGTADDVQIQAAIDYVNGFGGGTVFIKRGTYNCSSQIECCDNLTLIGEGYESEIKASTKDHQVFVSVPEGSPTRMTNITLKDIRFNGNQSGVQDWNLVYMINVDNLFVENVWVHNSCGHGLHVDTCTNTTVVGVKAYDNWLSGLSGFNDINTSWIGCQSWGNSWSGLSLDHSQQVTASNNHTFDSRRKYTP